MSRFSVLLVTSGLRKVDLAKALGRSKWTVSRWTDESAPRYAIEYLKLWIEVHRCQP